MYYVEVRRAWPLWKIVLLILSILTILGVIIATAITLPIVLPLAIDGDISPSNPTPEVAPVPEFMDI